MFITIPNIFKQMPMGRLFSVMFFLSVCFAGITSLINMFEAVIESWQNKFQIKRNHAVLLCGGLTLLVGLFLEEEARVGHWMDFITIIVVPLALCWVRFLSTISWALTESKRNWKREEKETSGAF